MNILVTGARGMVGTALCNNLKNIRDGKNRTRNIEVNEIYEYDLDSTAEQLDEYCAKADFVTALCNNLKNIRDGKNRTRNIEVNEIYEYDLDSTAEQLDEYCAKADFVFNLAGVNRPENPEDFMKGNFGFASQLLDTLKKHENKAGIMLSSSVQATLAGRFGNSEYGRSKKAGEELFFDYSKETGAPVYVYRFVNLMGHSRPKYNSAISTFCWAVANDEEFTVNDRSTELEVLYIDDLVEGMFMGHSRPKYNSAISTFCWAVANDEEFTVNDRSTELEVLYIDDLVEGMFDLLEGKEQHCEFDK